MPPHRPASPISLETCPPPTDEAIDSDGVLGSDDELDEDARVAQRQRIEKLAEAYIQGTPLFILSASLKGPFNQGWVNPWRKRRKPEHLHNVVEDSPGAVVQETDPRPRKQFDKPQESRHGKLSMAPSDPSEDLRVTSKQQDTHKSWDKQSRMAFKGTPKRAIPWTNHTQLNSQLRDASIARPEDDKWLKRDCKRIGFRDFDPPTSPTTTVSIRHPDTRNRAIKALSARQQSPVPRPKLQSPIKANERQFASSPARRLQATRRSESVVENIPHSSRPSPSKKQSSPHSHSRDVQSGDVNPGTSFCIVSSSSQLPKFEYRRKKRDSNEKTRSKSPIKQTEKKCPTPSGGRKEVEQFPEQEPTSSKESTKPRNNQDPMPTFTSTDTHTFSHSDSRLGQGQLESRTTGNTSENIPSAQPVPVNPALADFAPSLHSTALPTADSEDDGDTGSDPHLSTQAALLNAQRSFQDGLESPDPDHPTPSTTKRRASHSSALSSTNITPFFRLNRPHPDMSGDPSKAAATAVPSTQYMVEATTPFKFSTDKKRHVHIGSSSRILSSSKKQKIDHTTRSSSGSPLPWSPTRENRLNNIQQPSAKGSPQVSQHGSPSNPHDEPLEGSQVNELPLTLTGSTVPTGQDGQGDIAFAESFNLSQAIADAGSWLQDSFDLNKDLGQFGNNPRPPSTGDAQRSALSLDTH